MGRPEHKVTAAIKGTSQGDELSQADQVHRVRGRTWTQDRAVTWLDCTVWRPGRVQWNSECGERCFTNNAQEIAWHLEKGPNNWLVPVEDLTGIREVYAFDVRTV